MTIPTIRKFPPSVCEKIGYYVYLLIDPRTKKVFYVGKGKENRIFQHVYESGRNTDPGEKIGKIREIHAAGQEVEHIVLRHCLTDKEAFEVEAAIIDYIDLETLTNQVRGHYSTSTGRMTIDEIIVTYDAPEITIVEPAILIIINKLYRHNMPPEKLYDITRGKWVVGSRRSKAKYAFSVYNGIVRAVYEIEAWHPVMARSAEQKTQKRWEFDGKIAQDMEEKYLYGNVSHRLKIGAQNPIKYINC